MLKPGKLERVIKRGSSSLLTKLTIIFVVFILLQNGVTLVTTAMSRDRVLRAHFLGQMGEKMSLIEQLNRSRLSELDSFLASLPSMLPRLDSSLAAGDYESAGRMIAECVRLRGMRGFLLLDNRHEVAATSYGSYTDSQLDDVRGLARYAATSPSKSYSGYADVLGDGIGVVSVKVWADPAGRDVATLLVCHTKVEDDAYLVSLASLMSAETSVYRDNRISATSYDGHDVDIHGYPIPQEWVADSLKIYRKDVRLAEVAGTSDVFSAYTPMFDYRGRLLGIQHVWLNMRILSDVGSNMRRSVLVASLICTAIFIWLFVLLMRRTLIGPLLALRDDASRIASGDLSGFVIVPQTRDEVQQLSEAMERMHASLRHSVEVLTSFGLEIQKASAHIGKASQRLSNISCRQAASLEEVTSNIAEVGEGVKAMAGNADVTDHVVEQAREAVESIAQRSVESMNATRQIQGSLRAINSLVGQTNILSLNASVEAARAGSNGRGFAVVAHAVGGLAEQTRQTALAMAATSEASISGAENINRLIESVIPQIQRAADSVRGISRISKEQDEGLAQISAAAGSLNDATQETAADAEELAASAEELAAMAARMKKRLDYFSL